MSFRKSFVWMLVCSFFILMAAGCGDTEKTDIKIGLGAPMTGDSALWGQSALKAAQLAVDEVNEQGGIDGRKVVIVPGDDKGDPKEAASVAQKFISDPDIVAVVGHAFSTATLAAAPLYQSAGLPEMVFTASNPKIPKIGDYIFRINVSDEVAGRQTATYVVQELGLKKIAVIYDNMDYGVAFKDCFVEQAEKEGAEIPIVETYVGTQDRDFSVQLTKIGATNPDAILMVAYAAEAGLISQQAKQLGITAQLLGPDSMNSEHFLNIAKDAAEGTIITTYFDRGVPDPKAQEFVKKYEETYNEPTFTDCPYAYDAMLTVLDAIKRAGSTDKAAIKDALAQTKDLVGVTGNIYFDEDGDRPVAWNIVLEVKDGKFVIKDLIE